MDGWFMVCGVYKTSKVYNIIVNMYKNVKSCVFLRGTNADFIPQPPLPHLFQIVPMYKQTDLSTKERSAEEFWQYIQL